MKIVKGSVDEIFALVWPRCLLADADSPAIAGLNGMSDTLWMHLIDEAVHHDVVVYLHYKLLQLEDIVAIPPPAKDRLRLLARQHTLTSLRRTHDIGQILSILQNSGITPTLLKGAALAHTVYPSPACRSMVDFDLWLADEEMTEAAAILGRLGYQVNHDSTRPLAFQRRYEGELMLISPLNGRTTVELHWGAFVGEWIRRTAKVDREAVVGRRYATMISGYPVHLLSPEDAFLQILLHVAIHHQMSRYALRSMLDLGLLLQHGVDITTVIKRAQEWRIERVTRYVLTVMTVLLGVPETQAFSEAFHLGASVKDDMIHRIIRHEDIIGGHRFDTSRMRYAFLALLTDRNIDAATLFARTIWPEKEWLHLRYGTPSPAVRFRHLRSAFTGNL